MTQESFMSPSPANLATFAKAAPDRSIQMLNFLKFREKADYPDDHEYASKGWSGRQAYKQYGEEIAGPLARANAKTVWHSNPVGTVIGPDGEAWDAIFVVEYPNAAAFQTMVTDKEYLAGASNRTAALLDSRLYLTQSAE